MTTIEVKTEQEKGHGWVFEVGVDVDGTKHSYDVTLGWSDYDLWSRGQIAPQHVVRSVFEFLLSKEPVEAILPRFDCAIIRRYFPEVDRELPKLLKK